MMKIKIVLECWNDEMNDAKNTSNKFTINSKVTGTVQYCTGIGIGVRAFHTYHSITMLQYSTLHTHTHNKT